MPHATVSAGKPVTAPVLAGRPDGTGLVAWNDHSTVQVAEYHWDARRAGPKCIDEGTLDGPPLAVGAIPARIRRSALRGRGLRVALRTGKPANLVTVTLLGRSRGVLRALAQRRLRDVNGKRVVRLRVPARALRRVGRELTLTVHGRSGRGETIERRRLRLLD
jgi:hypothetical protein